MRTLITSYVTPTRIHPGGFHQNGKARKSRGAYTPGGRYSKKCIRFRLQLIVSRGKPTKTPAIVASTTIWRSKKYGVCPIITFCFIPTAYFMHLVIISLHVRFLGKTDKYRQWSCVLLSRWFFFFFFCNQTQHSQNIPLIAHPHRWQLKELFYQRLFVTSSV